MTTLSTARESIYQRFATDWGVTSDYTFDNEDFTPPEDTPWVRLVVRHTSSNQVSLGSSGNRKFDRDGLVFVQVFTPLDQGSAVADALVEKVLEIFEGKTIDLIRFTDVTPREVGPMDGWYQVNVDAAFIWTERK